MREIGQKINKLMEEHNVEFGALAEKLSVSKQTLTRKVNGTTDWTYGEIIILTTLFKIEDPESFFYD